jgi:putative spermidine/putrescine transport system ATP-binding protein
VVPLETSASSTPTDTPADGAVALDAVVRDVAYRGVDLLVTLDATDPAGTAVRLLADHRADTPTGPTPSVGDRVRLLAPEARLAHLTAEPATEGIS